MGHIMFMRKGTVHTAPISGTLASELAVGSVVKLMENGAAAEYLVVHQGLPSDMYDASCDGTWLLRKDCYESRQWYTSNYNSYEGSTIHNYLNSTFLSLLGETEQKAIQQVKIPYVNGTGTDRVDYGANGLSTKIFLLSCIEVSLSYGYVPSNEGYELSYFAGCTDYGADSKRISNLNGSSTIWWLRSPRTQSSTQVWFILPDGSSSVYSDGGLTNSCGIRPALILPSTALFDKNTLLLKGVAA